MAKVTIEFDSIEDKEEMEMCLNGENWRSLVWNFRIFIHNRLKHEDLRRGAYNELETVRDKLHQMMREDGLTFD
jgi:hypothetical protein